MADFRAVSEAVRLAEKKTMLLREVLQKRTSQASNVPRVQTHGLERKPEDQPPRK